MKVLLSPAKSLDFKSQIPTEKNSFLCFEKEAEYLNSSKEGAIVLSDPAEGPVTTTLNPDRSKTDLFNISLGIGF